MPDDLQIPIAAPGLQGRAPTSATYRPRASGRRAIRAVPLRTTLAAAAAAVCALVLAAIGTWSLLHRTPAQVPVIEADARPIRIKPENPGGMQVADAEDATTGPGDQRMAPAAEAPAPQALRAQMQPPAAPPASQAVPATPPAPPLSASPLPDTPRPAARTVRPAQAPAQPASAQPASAPPASAQPAPVLATPSTPGTSVQIAAVDSEPAAQTEWQRLQKRLPDLLADRRPLMQKAERDGRTIWRVRVPGFTDVADATAFCTKVRARGANCAIASF